jgi:hypothetical protein
VRGKAGSLIELDPAPARAATNDANTKKLYLEIVSAGYEWAELEV